MLKTITKNLRALSDETRLRILHLIGASGELCVCDIESIIGGPQTKISRHLGYLRRAGLVNARKKGLWVLYSLASEPDLTRTELLECVNRLLKSSDQAKRDQIQLRKNISRGCCATFTEVKPGEIPLSFQMTKGEHNEC
jgi:ArsR family transcriptional regulator